MTSCALAAPRGATVPPADPVLNDAAEVERYLRAFYQKEIEKKIKNEALFYKGRKLSQIKKLVGDKDIPGPAAGPAAQASPCEVASKLFVRRDRLDTFQLRENTLPVANAKGASVSVTQDNLTNSTNVTINGRIQYLMHTFDPRPGCDGGDPYAPFDLNLAHLGYAIAPFVDAQGAVNIPRKASDSSNVQLGVDFQASVIGGFFDHQHFVLTPYYQTDFRHEASAVGVRLGWEPVMPDINLGGRLGVPNPYLDWYWQVRGETDVKNVSDPGATGLTKGTYYWLGGTARVYFNLFPGRGTIEPTWEPPVPFLVDRLFASAGINWHWNAKDSTSVHMWEAEVGYNLTTDGKSSISLKYNDGMEKDTFKATRRYLISLNYKQ